ncbi:MAG: aminotransferase class V-fold PLP-dependent enzyme [Bdellovibrionota bacterium]
MIYFDNASTYHPKSPKIPEAISQYLNQIIASPGRGGHSHGQMAGRLQEETKEVLRGLFNAERTDQFHFCANATHGLNFIIQSLIGRGDHVVTSALEHNSVLRPLKKMSHDRQAEITIVPASSEGRVDPENIISSTRPNTKLVVLNHASNVLGTVLPLEKILRFCKDKGISTLVDTSQTAGKIKIDLQKLPMDFMVATGHKALRGPSGIGVIYTRRIDLLSPLIVGGTGGNSLSLWHPENPQHIFEAGTPNYLGIAALKASLEDFDIEYADLPKELEIINYIQKELRKINGVTLYGCSSLENRIPIVSFNINGLSSQKALAIYDETYGIMLRAGLHCAPIAHQMIASLPHGALRLSLGHANTMDEAATFIESTQNIVAENQSGTL